MFCGCALSLRRAAEHAHLPGLPGPPGTLPVTNAEAIHFGLMIGLALGCEIAPRSIFHRKNYFYPDLPKGYQISQYDDTALPAAAGSGDVRIHRVHLEEDAAKLIHVGASGRIHGSDASIVDFNRGGTPLAEIVTEPDVRSAEQAREWLRLLRDDAAPARRERREHGGGLAALRRQHLHPAGRLDELGTKTELKNMNSFRFIERGIRAEIARQERAARGGRAGRPGDAALRSGARRRSRRCAPRRRRTTTATSPSPTCPPVRITEAMLERARAAMPELPAAREERFERDSASTPTARACCPGAPSWATTSRPRSPPGNGAAPQQVANWTSELAGQIEVEDPAQSAVEPAALAKLVQLVADKAVTRGRRQAGLEILIAAGGDPAQIVESEGLGAVGGADELTPSCARRSKRTPTSPRSFAAAT